MKVLLYCLSLGILLNLASCSKDDNDCPYTDNTVNVPASEILALEGYLAGKGLTATLDPRGFYYQVKKPGEGAKAGVCDDITIFYKGKLTNDLVFDQTGASPRVFVLGELIEGWKKGIPLIGEGGSISLYLPPSLGYGNNAVGGVPAGSITIFDIDLVSID